MSDQYNVTVKFSRMDDKFMASRTYELNLMIKSTCGMPQVIRTVAQRMDRFNLWYEITSVSKGAGVMPALKEGEEFQEGEKALLRSLMNQLQATVTVDDEIPF